MPDYHTESVINKLYSILHTHAFTREGLLDVGAKAGFKMVHDFDVEYYQTMIFAPSDLEVTRESSSSKKGENAVLTDVAKSFCMNKSSLNNWDLVVQSSNVVRPHVATYKYIGPEMPIVNSPEELLPHLPIRVQTSFSEPRMLFE